MLTEISDENFEQSIASGLSLVLFYKDQCPFCQAMKKIIAKFSAMSAASTKEIEYFQINRETHPQSTQAMGVERVPTVITFKDGVKLSQKSGDITYRDLERMITEG
ncbi:MAG: thioredoxin family protein [Deltaproteobacteria bacterium]|nr:thioredoxin family protein [Deltaproteobacteria bacterium]